MPRGHERRRPLPLIQCLRNAPRKPPGPETHVVSSVTIRPARDQVRRRHRCKIPSPILLGAGPLGRPSDGYPSSAGRAPRSNIRRPGRRCPRARPTRYHGRRPPDTRAANTERRGSTPYPPSRPAAIYCAAPPPGREKAIISAGLSLEYTGQTFGPRIADSITYGIRKMARSPHGAAEKDAPPPSGLGKAMGGRQDVLTIGIALRRWGAQSSRAPDLSAVAGRRVPNFTPRATTKYRNAATARSADRKALRLPATDTHRSKIAESAL